MKKTLTLKAMRVISATVSIALFPSFSFAAEAELPIKARIVRCVSQQERLVACSKQSLCCSLLDSSQYTNETAANENFSVSRKKQNAKNIETEHQELKI